MYFKELSTYEKAATDATHQCVLTANDLTQATVATAQSFNVAALPVGAIVTNCWLRLVTPFQNPADAAFNSATVDVGDTGSATRWLTAQQINANGAFITAPQYNATVGGPYAASQFLTVNINSMAAKALVNLKVGELHVYWQILNTQPLTALQTATPLTK